MKELPYRLRTFWTIIGNPTRCGLNSPHITGNPKISMVGISCHPRHKLCLFLCSGIFSTLTLPPCLSFIVTRRPRQLQDSSFKAERRKQENNCVYLSCEHSKHLPPKHTRLPSVSLWGGKQENRPLTFLHLPGSSKLKRWLSVAMN